ncbi:MAG: hypothetical protein H7X89_10490, partial [Rhizobiales bacterium]|nr:hypothetical protein [Hyphomicrobiales bacterium]
MSKSLSSVLLFLAVGASTSACALIGPLDPTDLRLKSLEMVDWKDQDEIIPVGGGSRRSLALIRVEFSTERDLQALAQRYGYNMYNQASLCVAGAYSPPKDLAGFGHVYDRFGEIDGIQDATS